MMEYRVTSSYCRSKSFDFESEEEARAFADKKAKTNKLPLIVLKKESETKSQTIYKGIYQTDGRLSPFCEFNFLK